MRCGFDKNLSAQAGRKVNYLCTFWSFLMQICISRSEKNLDGWPGRLSDFFFRPGAELGQLDLVFGFPRTWKLVGQLKGLKCIWFHQNLSVYMYIATKRNWCKILYTIYFKWFCRLDHLFILSSSWLRFSQEIHEWTIIFMAHPSNNKISFMESCKTIWTM